MEDDFLTALFAEPLIEIIPPQKDDAAQDCPKCLSCGRPAEMDDDCCGICERCLSP